MKVFAAGNPSFPHHVGLMKLSIMSMWLRLAIRKTSSAITMLGDKFWSPSCSESFHFLSPLDDDDAIGLCLHCSPREQFLQWYAPPLATPWLVYIIIVKYFLLFLSHVSELDTWTEVSNTLHSACSFISSWFICLLTVFLNFAAITKIWKYVCLKESNAIGHGDKR